MGWGSEPTFWDSKATSLGLSLWPHWVGAEASPWDPRGATPLRTSAQAGGPWSCGSQDTRQSPLAGHACNPTPELLTSAAICPLPAALRLAVSPWIFLPLLAPLPFLSYSSSFHLPPLPSLYLPCPNTVTMKGNLCCAGAVPG